MRILGGKVLRHFDPLSVSGSLQMTGGSGVQFYDGNSYVPNREGTPSSPLIIEHIVSATNPNGGLMSIEKSTKYYENDVLILSTTPKYSLIDGKLRVEKNITAGTAVTIKAVSQFVDPRSQKIYERVDVTYLRCSLKLESKFQILLSKSGVYPFSAFHNPNINSTIDAIVYEGDTEIASYSGITFKWLNSDGLDLLENELYGNSITNNGRRLSIDQTYIDRESIVCEAWRGQERIGQDSVTVFRDIFGGFTSKVTIPEIMVFPGMTHFNCGFTAYDSKGAINVDSVFVISWGVTENNVDRIVGTGSTYAIPISSVNMDTISEIWVEIKRREAWRALIDNDGYILVDDNDNVLTVEILQE